MPWDLTGNAGTNPSTNFLGTTDNQPLVIKTNGSESMRITANGTVGIGTNLPAYARLEIVGTTPSTSTQYDSIIAFAGTDGEIGSLYHRSNGATSIFGIESFNVGNTIKTPLVLQEYGGNVGIGTNSPFARLEVVGTTPSTSTTYNSIIGFAGTDGGIGSLYHKSNGATSILGIESFNVGNTIKTPLVLQEYGGNVGIGTNSPFARLEVVGTTPSTSTQYDSIIGFAGTDGGIGSLYHKSNGATSIFGIESFNVGNTAKTPLVLQEYGGNVGIGTSRPDATLTVAGLIHNTAGGIRFPDGSIQTTATLRGPQGPQGPQGPRGPSVHTSAVCGPNPCNLVCSTTVIAQQSGACAITSDTGSCNAPAGDWCCVCAP